jgi:tripeptide aminopeptidase
VKARIVRNYDGKAVVLNEELGIILDPAVFPTLKENVGQDLIVTDGTTLLGADDKAGVAEIMTLVEYLLEHPEVPHGKICVCFTPDEEVGNGPAFFDVEGFGAELAYTVDGGGVSGLNYETFNAASAQVEIKGNVVHPGYAKGKMRNAALVATRFQAMLPPEEHPANTDGYEGYFHLTHIKGNVSGAKLNYLLRDFELDGLEKRKEVIRDVARKLNEEYGTELVTVSIKDSYRNMKEKILPHMELIEFAAEAMTECGMKPVTYPVRGGTDGAQLSFMGLPCPNLCMGGYNGHGPYEYCTVQNLELIVNMLIKLVGKFIRAAE